MELSWTNKIKLEQKILLRMDPAYFLPKFYYISKNS